MADRRADSYDSILPQLNSIMMVFKMQLLLLLMNIAWLQQKLPFSAKI